MLTRTRPWLAAGLALLYPGLGHVYLRAWFRALAWFGLAVVTLTLFVLPEMSTTPSSGFGAFYSEFTTLPAETLFPLFMVNAFNVVDAYLLGQRRSADGRATPSKGDDESPACPNCGRELDEDLDFCPWCTTRLDEGDAE